MSDFVGAAINTADLASKLTGIAVDFLSGIGCEAFCEVLDIGKDFLFEALRSGKINHQTKKALENLDQRTVDDLKHFVSRELQKYSKKGKLPKKLKGKDLVDVFMNRLDTVSKLVDDYAAQNNLSEDRKIALKYILNEIRQCTAQASLDMLEAEDKRLVLVISQIVRNTFEDYREDFAPQLAKTLFYRPTHCSHCASSSLLYDDAKGIAACKNCGKKMEYTQSGQSALLAEAKASFHERSESESNLTIEELIAIGDCYYFGDTVSKDYTKAVKWYKIAERKGSVVAKFKLGHCYYFGIGIEMDKHKGELLIESAAKQNCKQAIDFLSSENTPFTESKADRAISWKAIAMTAGALFVPATIYGIIMNAFHLTDTMFSTFASVFIGGVIATVIVYLIKEECKESFLSNMLSIDADAVIPTLLWMAGTFSAGCLFLGCVFPVLFAVMGIFAVLAVTVSLFIILYHVKNMQDKGVRVAALSLIGADILAIAMLVYRIYLYNMNV